MTDKQIFTTLVFKARFAMDAYRQAVLHEDEKGKACAVGQIMAYSDLASDLCGIPLEKFNEALNGWEK